MKFTPNSRRKFLKTASLGAAGLLLPSFKSSRTLGSAKAGAPLVLSTWDFGLQANAHAWKVISSGGSSLDAIESGINYVENDPNERSVGLGGRPDREGRVSLDACIMDERSGIGSVANLEHIKNPISVARRVMEHTPHTMLVGEGALEFAFSQGFIKEDLLTEQSAREWADWKQTSKYVPKVNIENHDTIGMIALDTKGNLSGGCSTSGMAYKMKGRVGDSPIIGAGLYVDNSIGAATATGHGEEIMRTVGSFLVVELMRQGYTPEQACKEAIRRIEENFRREKRSITDTQIGFIAISKAGHYGAYSLQTGFTYAVKSDKEEILRTAPHAFK